MNFKKFLILQVILLFCASKTTQGIDMATFYRNTPVLITGGCGFIGSHIASQLVELGAQVTIIDDLSTGSLKNIEHIKDKVTVIQKSILDKSACLEAAKEKKVIFHLAAFISVPDSMAKPDACYATNIDGTINILEAARLRGVERLVFSSSAAVYGPATYICSENSPTDPQSPYGYSKLIGELLCQQYAKNFGLNTVVLRYFNVWGERQNPNGAYAAVVAKFMDQMKQNLPITIFGDGMQTRDFVPVSKVAQANLTLALFAPQIAGNVYNIATGKSITLIELIDQLKNEYPTYKNQIVFAPARPGDIKFSTADCGKYFKLIAQL